MIEVLVIQIFEIKPQVPGELEKKLNTLCLPFVIDNFSDPTSIAYARQFISELEDVKVIVWEHGKGDLRPVQPLLNLLLKFKRKSLLITNSTNIRITQLSKALNTKNFGSAEELLGWIKSQG